MGSSSQLGRIDSGAGGAALLRSIKTAALVALRQWVISFPFALRFLFATHPQSMGKVLGIHCRTIATHQVHKAGFQLEDACAGAVTLI